MRVGMIQSNYIPWRGYFDFINAVDCFVLYDDVLYGRGKKWRNRNKIRTQKGTQWLTIPIIYTSTSRICDVQISYALPWIDAHCSQIMANYQRAPFFDDYFLPFREILEQKFERLSDLNFAIIRWICNELSIRTQLLKVEELNHPLGPKETRPIEILRRLDATSYLTGPNTLNYTDCEIYQRYGMDILVKTYTYTPYPQLFAPFVGDVSILDLLFNTGPCARDFLTSSEPNRKIHEYWSSMCKAQGVRLGYNLEKKGAIQ
jgi:hypothetical protein